MTGQFAQLSKPSYNLGLLLHMQLPPYNLNGAAEPAALTCVYIGDADGALQVVRLSDCSARQLQQQMHTNRHCLSAFQTQHAAQCGEL